MSSSKAVAPIKHEDRPIGKAFTTTKFTETKANYEKLHNPEQAKGNGKTYDNPALTKVTFEVHNTRSTGESKLEKVMT